LVLTLSARGGVLCGGGGDGSGGVAANMSGEAYICSGGGDGGEAATMSGVPCIGLRKPR